MLLGEHIALGEESVAEDILTTDLDIVILTASTSGGFQSQPKQISGMDLESVDHLLLSIIAHHLHTSRYLPTFVWY